MARLTRTSNTLVVVSNTVLMTYESKTVVCVHYITAKDTSIFAYNKTISSLFDDVGLMLAICL